jgi:hypothetical protein
MLQRRERSRRRASELEMANETGERGAAESRKTWSKAVMGVQVMTTEGKGQDQQVPSTFTAQRLAGGNTLRGLSLVMSFGSN